MSRLGPLASPALLETRNMSSFVDISNNTSSPRSDESDDEIIYNISEAHSLSENESSCSTALSDNDFVVLSRPRSQRSLLGTESPSSNHDDDARADTSGITDLVSGFADFSVTPNLGGRQRKEKSVQIAANVETIAKKRKKQKKTQFSSADAAASSSPGPSPHSRREVSTTLVVSEKRNAAKRKPNKVKKEKLNAPAGRHLAGNKFSNYSEGDVGSPSMYEEASGFITSFLANPAARKDSACRLTFLQALIIELGLADFSLPCSLKAAKAFLKSRAFLNINEYIAVRDQGPAAVRRIMYPNRAALMKEIRKNKSRAPRGWVKDMGLQVLLVQCHH